MLLGLVVTQTTVLLMVVSLGTSTMMRRTRTGIGAVGNLLVIIYPFVQGYVSEVNLALVWANKLRGLKDSRHKSKSEFNLVAPKPNSAIT